jgi:surfeit locus 1 family protein
MAPQPRRIPVFATMLVLVAVGVMVALGLWQLRRLHEKEALLARYQAAQGTSAEVPWPTTPEAAELALYRRSRLLCLRVTETRAAAGRSARGEAGLGLIAQCGLADGSAAMVVLGWSRDPTAQARWNGGEVRGIIAPGPRLVADPPLAGLAANERPDPSAIPNNHLAYAGQWFFFALTALVVYVIALRKRLSSRA